MVLFLLKYFLNMAIFDFLRRKPIDTPKENNSFPDFETFKRQMEENSFDVDTIKEELVYTLGYEKQSNILDNLIEKYNVEVK